MKVCPHCGKVVFYNSYFGAYICDNCGWEYGIAGKMREEGTRICGTSAVVMTSQKAVIIRKAAQKGRSARAGTRIS